MASEPNADLSTNTTPHLIEDIEALRIIHGVEAWTILGLSWGTTLGLAYAQTHPDRIQSLVLGLVTTTSRREVEWLTQDVGRIFPEEWNRFVSAIPDRLRHLRPVDAYAEMLFDPDPSACEFAASEWCHWEDTHVSLTPGHEPSLQYADPEFRLRFARLVTHYWSNAGFLEEEQLLRNASILNGIPGTLIHGRWDVSSPMETPWRLSQEWSTSRLQILDDAGHGGGDSLLRAIVDALDERHSSRR